MNKRKWTDQAIKNGINDVKRQLGISYTPNKVEIQSVCQVIIDQEKDFRVTGKLLANQIQCLVGFSNLETILAE